MRSVFRPSLTLWRCVRTRGRAHAWCAQLSVHTFLLCGLMCACSSDQWDPHAPTTPLAGGSGAAGSAVPPQLSGGGGTVAMPQQSGTGGSGGSGGQAPRAGASGMIAPTQQSGSGGAGGTGGVAGNGAVTFTRIYETVFVSCRSELCHGGALDVPGVGLDMQTRDSAYMTIVGRAAAASGPCASSGLMRVVAGEPDRSLLFLKYSGNPPCGDEMPPGVTNSKDEIELLRSWIAGGALNN